MFRSRKEAGQLLAGRLAVRGYLRPVVLGVSASGVALAYQVALALGAPLHVAPAASSDLPPIAISGRSAILVSDALVTGDGTAAALRILRSQAPRRIVVAAPVADPQRIDELRPEADEVVYLIAASRFAGVESLYEELGAVSNEDVLALLESLRLRPG